MSCCPGPRPCPDLDPDAEGPSADDLARFGDDDRICGECGAPNYYDAPLCASCGVAFDAEGSGGLKPWMLAVAGATCIAMIAVLMF